LLAATSIGCQLEAAKLESMTDPLADASALALPLASAEEAEPDALLLLPPVLELELLDWLLTMFLTQYCWLPESMAQTAFRKGLTT
jgi:hypothetical protein